MKMNQRRRFGGGKKQKTTTSNSVMFDRYIRQTALFLNASQKLVKPDVCIISINEVMRKKNKISVSSVLSLRPFTRSKHRPLRIDHKCMATVNSNKLLLGRKCSCFVSYSTKHKSQWRSAIPKGENGLTLCGNICFCFAVAHQKTLMRTMSNHPGGPAVLPGFFPGLRCCPFCWLHSLCSPRYHTVASGLQLLQLSLDRG